jgi:DNA-binding response OmpR family regulator
MINLSKLSVLAVQQNQDMLDMLKFSLQAMGFGRVYTASSGEKAFTRFLEVKPDILITGWELGKMSGIDLAKSIRRDKNLSNRQIPIIFLTGYSTEQRVTAALNCGINAYLIKPFTAKKLADRITKMINKPPNFIENDNYFGPDYTNTNSALSQSNRGRS